MAFYKQVLAGDADVAVPLKIIDSTDGTPETGVTATTTGLDVWYHRPGAALVTITLAAVTIAQAHADGGFVHKAYGRYRLDLPDAAVATGVDWVEYGGTVTSMIVIGGLLQLTGVDPATQWPPATLKAIVTTTITGDGGASPWGPEA